MQGDAARALGLSQAGLSMYECAHRDVPSHVLIGMARLYGVPLARILSEEDV